MKLILALLFCSFVYSQQSRLTIKIENDSLVYDLRYCYKKLKTVKTSAGKKFRVVVWNSYAPWGKSKHLIIRSLDGMYSTQREIENLKENVTVIF